MDDLSDKLGISIASYIGHYEVIEECIKSCLSLKAKYVGLSVENRNINTENHPNGYLSLFEEMDSVSFIKNLIASKGGSWISQHLSNISLIKTFNSEIEYLLLINGDCIIGDSVGFYEVLKEFILGNFDVIPTARFSRKGRCFGTMGIIGKIDPIIKMLGVMNDLVSDKTFVRSGNEQRMAIACRKLNLKVFNVVSSNDVSFCSLGEGTWAGRMKFFHLHNKWSKNKYGLDGWWNSEKKSS